MTKQQEQLSQSDHDAVVSLVTLLPEMSKQIDLLHTKLDAQQIRCGTRVEGCNNTFLRKGSFWRTMTFIGLTFVALFGFTYDVNSKLTKHEVSTISIPQAEAHIRPLENIEKQEY